MQIFKVLEVVEWMDRWERGRKMRGWFEKLFNTHKWKCWQNHGKVWCRDIM